MNFEIIFYRSGKTAAIQQFCEKTFKSLDIDLTYAAAASDKEELGEMLSSSLKRSKLIITFGGIDGSAQSSEKILSKILKPKNKKDFDSLKVVSDKADNSFYIKSGGQVMLILPDDTDLLSDIKNDIINIIKKEFSIKSDYTENEPDLNKIDSEIETDISITKRTRIIPSGSTAEKRNDQKLRTLKIIMIVLICLGVTELAAAALIFFLNNSNIR